MCSYIFLHFTFNLIKMYYVINTSFPLCTEYLINYYRKINIWEGSAYAYVHVLNTQVFFKIHILQFVFKYTINTIWHKCTCLCKYVQNANQLLVEVIHWYQDKKNPLHSHKKSSGEVLRILLKLTQLQLQRIYQWNQIPLYNQNFQWNLQWNLQWDFKRHQ